MNETTHYHLHKPEDHETADVAVLNENCDIIDAALAAKADLDPGTGKVSPEQLPPIDVSGSIAAHDADATAHATLGFLRAEDAEPGEIQPNDADTLEGRTTAELQAAFAAAFAGKLAPAAHAAGHAKDGADAVTPAAIGAAVGLAPVSCAFPVAGWVSGGGSWVQTVACPGILTTDGKRAVVSPMGSTDKAAQKLTDEAEALVDRYSCDADGQLTARCPDTKPGVNFTVQVVIVREGSYGGV